MDIKEIALKHSREYLTFKLGDRKGLDVAEIVCDDEIYAEIVDELAQQFEALISAYKAELLKGVGEPAAYYDPDLDCGSAGISFDPLSDGIGLFTSDQVAAVVLKATKSLEDQLAKQNEPVMVLFQHEDTGRTTSIEPQGASDFGRINKRWINCGPLFSFPPTAEQIANETAEAIAKMLEGGSFLSTESKVALAANGAAKAIRRGAWKEFKK